MNKEIQSIIRNLQNVYDGEPWYGRAVNSILEEINPDRASIRPANGAHSALELLYHMLTWMEFTLKRLENSAEMDSAKTEELDWRTLNPDTDTWEKAMRDFRSVHDKIISTLREKNDSLLQEIVDYRNYNFRVLLNGLIQHNIYHLGQITYINKYFL